MVFMTIIVATIIGSVKRGRKIRAGPITIIVANIIVLEIRGGRAEAGEAGG